MFFKDKPIIPSLHKCYWCKCRLNKHMDIIRLNSDLYETSDWFCSPKCARKFYQHKLALAEEERKLNDYIREEEE